MIIFLIFINNLINFNELNSNEFIDVYVDGACSGNPGPGGWGIFAEQPPFFAEFFGGEEFTTNNRMELLAVINALNLFSSNFKLKILTDSMYVKNGITTWIKSWKKNSWKTSSKNDVKNVDLWTNLDSLVSFREIKWEWVRGHSYILGNERADALAKKGIISILFSSENKK